MLRRGSNGFHFRILFSCLHSLKKTPILYSTSVASNDGVKRAPMVEFLVKSVGFSEQEAISVATKVKLNSPLIARKKSELVVDYLKESGFDGTQIRKLVASRPRVLRSKVDETLKPKIRAFEELGFFGSNLGQFISRHPRVLSGCSLESRIVPVLEILKPLFSSNEHLVSFMLQMKSQRLFSSHVCKNLPASVLLLQSYGLPSEKIKWLMIRRFLLFENTQWVKRIAKGVEEKLGIPRTSDMFMYGIYGLTAKSEANMESWLESFHSYGWSQTEISSLLRLQPLIMGLSEKLVRLKLKYFMEDLGLGSDFLATHPALLSYSMERRIVPRVAVRRTLMDGGLLERPVSVYSFLMIAESMFMQKYVIPYKDKLPQLYEHYTQATGYCLLKH